jgi:glutamate--cysteine ligase
MLYSLLTDSPRIDARERRAIDASHILAAHRGREPGLELARRDGSAPLKAWASDVLDAMQPLAELLDGGADGPHSDSLRAQREKVADPDGTPSARMLREMRERGEGFAQFARRVTEQHRDYFRSLELDPERDAWLRGLSATSIERQHTIEAADDIDFATFLQTYFAQSEEHPVEIASPFAL